MARSKSNTKLIKQTISSLTSISGYIIGSVLIGMYIDQKFFNSNGISIIVAVLIGILAVVINFVRLVILSRDD